MSPPETNEQSLARAAADAAAATKELADKKARRARPASKRKPRAPKAPPRMKIIWGVGRPGVLPLKTFPYAEKGAAEADAERRGGGCVVRPLKVPME